MRFKWHKQIFNTLLGIILVVGGIVLMLDFLVTFFKFTIGVILLMLGVWFWKKRE